MNQLFKENYYARKIRKSIIDMFFKTERARACKREKR